MNRRRFARTLSAATAACASGAVPSSRAMPELDLVDTHQHLWDPAVIRPPWLETAPAILRAKHDLAAYREATAGYRVTAVYMEIDVAEADLDREAEAVIALCRDPGSGTVAATIGGRPDAPGFQDYVKRHAASGQVRGVRQVLHQPGTPAGHCLRPEFVAGIRFLGEEGLHFDLCLRPTELGDGVALAKACPGTRFVVDHCGNAEVKAFLPVNPGHDGPTADRIAAEAWKRSMDALAALPNTVCKISGIIARLPPGMPTEALAPIVEHCLDAFGPERVLFGGDWPVCRLGAPLRTWIEGLADIIRNRPEAEQAALWAGNARKFYRLA
jgi:L-fuconolactonase